MNELHVEEGEPREYKEDGTKLIKEERETKIGRNRGYSQKNESYKYTEIILII